MIRWVPLGAIVAFGALLITFPPLAWLLFLLGMGVVAFTGDAARG